MQCTLLQQLNRLRSVYMANNVSFYFSLMRHKDILVGIISVQYAGTVCDGYKKKKKIIRLRY